MDLDCSLAGAKFPSDSEGDRDTLIYPVGVKQNVSAEIPLQPRTQIQISNVQRVMAVGIALYILENSYRFYISK